MKYEEVKSKVDLSIIRGDLELLKVVTAVYKCPIPRYNTQTNTPSNQAYTKGISSEILAYYGDLLTRGRLTDDITSSHSANNL